MDSMRQATPTTPAATNAGTGAKHKREAGSGAGINAWRTLVASRTIDLRTLGQSVYENLPTSLSVATVALRLRAQLGAPPPASLLVGLGKRPLKLGGPRSCHVRLQNTLARLGARLLSVNPVQTEVN